MPSSDYKFNLQFKEAWLGLQFMFVAFGALVLVPLLVGLDPQTALLTAGVGTLIFQVITKGQIPVFLASSFAFLPAMILGAKSFGVPGMLCGLLAAGMIYLLLSAILKVKGSHTLIKLFPPIVTGPIIVIIGLILAPVAVNMSLGKTGDGATQLISQDGATVLSMLALGICVAVSVLAKGMLRLSPVMSALAVGFITSHFMGFNNYETVFNAAWFSIPTFETPEWNWSAIILIAPIAIAPAIEHFGDMMAIGAVTKRNYIEKPGIHRSLLGDGVATIFAALIGGPPNTTYSEVTGAVAITKVKNAGTLTWTALFAIGFSFVGKLGALLQAIPVPVMGGIMIFLFGIIAVLGMQIVSKDAEALATPRGMSIAGVILVIGVGGMAIGGDDFQLKGIGLASIVGVVLHVLLPKELEPAQDAAKGSKAEIKL